VNSDQTIHLDKYAWREGFQARPGSVCPYPAGSTEALSWASGRVEGARHFGDLSAFDIEQNR
jgi:hypothetical protein